jgi:hypothetical protein
MEGACCKEDVYVVRGCPEQRKAARDCVCSEGLGRLPRYVSHVVEFVGEI